MTFDWINFLHAVMLLKEEGCPKSVFLELRVLVVMAIKSERLTRDKLMEYDLRINTTTKQIKSTNQN